VPPLEREDIAEALRYAAWRAEGTRDRTVRPLMRFLVDRNRLFALRRFPASPPIFVVDIVAKVANCRVLIFSP